MPDLTNLEDAGWQIDVEGGEIHAEHVDSGQTHVFDAEGGVHAPDGETTDSGTGTLEAASTVTGACTIECDETTGEVTVHSENGISMQAPAIDIAGRDRVDISSPGVVNVFEESDVASTGDVEATVTDSRTNGDAVVSQAGTDTLEEASTDACTIECDETTGEVTIYGENRVSMRAPIIRIAGGDRVDISSPGVVNVFEESDVASIGAFPNGAAATDSVHRVEVPVGSELDGAGLSTVTVDYPADFDVSAVTATDVLGAGVERTGGTIDFIEVSEVTSSDNGTTVTFTIGNDLQLGTDETVILEYRRVTNASTEGDYVAVAGINGTEVGPASLAVGPETDTPAPVVSTFEEDDEGWEISGDAQGSSTVPTFEDGTGTPAPSISAVDDVAGGVWYFSAPGKFLANKSAYYGGTLEYDLLQEYSGSASQFDSADIVLSGGGMTLTYDHGDASSHPGGGDSGVWTSYTVTLAETDAWKKGDGNSPSGSEMLTVLSDLTELRIRGEYRDGSDKGYLDTVRMAPGGEGALTLGLPDGTLETVAAVENDQPVAEYYGFDTTDDKSADLPDALTIADATVSFVYRNAETGEHSLVTVHDDPTNDTGGAAVLTFGGVSDAQWLAKDDTEDITPPQDRYETPDGTFGSSESAAWKWNSDRTDGGVIGPLGASFDVVMTHRASGTVRDVTRERQGLDRWLFVDGADPSNPVELTTFADGIGDVSARITTGDIDTTPGGDPGDVFDGLQLLLNGNTAVASAEGNVEAWQDATENGFDFTQSDPAKRPTLVADAINGHPALRFDGEDDHFIREDTLGIPNDSARTLVVVCRLTDTTERSPYLMQGKFDATGTGSNSYGLEANTFKTAGERFGLYLISVAKDSERSTDTNYNVHVMQTADASSLSAMENSTTYYVNGQQIPFTDTGGGVRNSPLEADSTAIGTFPQSDPSALMHGEIAEIFAFDRALLDSERSSLEAALFEKYGLGT
ncbi:MAG: laminin B domain-containing protein [Halobacteriales archaeon]